jgi:hypothetical protein
MAGTKFPSRENGVDFELVLRMVLFPDEAPVQLSAQSFQIRDDRVTRLAFTGVATLASPTSASHRRPTLHDGLRVDP